MGHAFRHALVLLIGGCVVASAGAEQRLGRFIGVIEGLPEVRRVAFADHRTAYAIHEGEPPVVRLVFGDPDSSPRVEWMTAEDARQSGAPEALWEASISPEHPLWIDPPPERLITPIALARDEAGNTVLLDQHANTLHRFDISIGAWKSIGDWGAFPGLFAHPGGVAAAAGRIYVADTRNHRIQVFDDRLSYIGEWGLHVVRPHEDNGHLHYPGGIAVSGDGMLAVVAEPIQDRLQIFGVVREGDAAAIAEPMFERETIAHFGPHAARDGRLFVTTEPDRPGLIVWDLSRPLPIMIGQIVGQGDDFGRFRSMGDVAMRIDGPNGVPRIWALDPAKQRLQVFDLEWSAEKEIGFDPFLARFVRAFDLGTVFDPDHARIEGFVLRDDGSLVLHDAGGGRLVLTDGRLSPRRVIDAVHEPDARVHLRAGPDENTLAILHARTGWLELVGVDGTEQNERFLMLDDPDAGIVLGASDPSAPGFAPEQPIDYTDLLFSSDDGARCVWIVDRRSHRVLRYALPERRDKGSGASSDQSVVALPPDLVLGLHEGGIAKRPGERLAATMFHKPSGLLLDNFGHVVVLDEGNHRIQFFDRDGRFLDTYGARWYTQPARRGAPGRLDP